VLHTVSTIERWIVVKFVLLFFFYLIYGRSSQRRFFLADIITNALVHKLEIQQYHIGGGTKGIMQKKYN
jgi:hypothetical protein